MIAYNLLYVKINTYIFICRQEIRVSRMSTIAGWKAASRQQVAIVPWFGAKRGEGAFFSESSLRTSCGRQSRTRGIHQVASGLTRGNLALLAPTTPLEREIVRLS